jgi:hypothetical protein
MISFPTVFEVVYGTNEQTPRKNLETEKVSSASKSLCLGLMAPHPSLLKRFGADISILDLAPHQ